MFVQRRIDGVDAALEALIGPGVHPDGETLADRQPRQIGLRHPEIQLHRAEAFQIGDVVAGLYVSAGADRAQSHRASERRADHGFIQSDSIEFLGGAGGVQLGLGFVQMLLARQILALQILQALVAARF